MASPNDSTLLQKFKLVFLGEQSVGKTAIISRLMYDSFEETYLATIGIDFLSKTLYLEDRTVRLQLWDTADSAVAVIIYDISDRNSFANTAKWIEDARQERGQEVILVLVGNKTDLGDKRVVSTEEGEKRARETGAMFMETSAKAGHNVKELFKKIARALPYNTVAGQDGAVGARGNMVDVTLNPTQNKIQKTSDCAC
ncbi:hypothetical protein BB561_003732 [Smittium simulii]|uniref:Uncharacterized protein n=1 Tax=Smittium simulii TaxID=133385 RepID=A0A2T9YJT6_9FUNG|nr:hypothetical protein BB561_003732 [Smittium simulii]